MLQLQFPKSHQELPKKTSSVQLGTSSRSPKDMTSFEWALKYQDDLRGLILILGKITRPEVIQGGNIFSYGKVHITCFST